MSKKILKFFQENKIFQKGKNGMKICLQK